MRDIERAEGQLDRILGFFPRVEARITALFAAVTVILGFSALNIGYSDLTKWYVSIPAVLLVLILCCAYYFLYKANFPDIQGGHDSIIYFSEIQKRTERMYIEKYEETSDDDYRRDLLGQVWRNSQILSEKYKNIKYAIYCLAASMVPFVVVLTASALINSRLPLLKG